MGKLVNETGIKPDLKKKQPYTPALPKGVEVADLEGRDVAPELDIDISDLLKDERVELLQQLDKENPEFKHSYQRHDVTDRELSMKGQEILDKVNFHHMGDPVVRQPRKTFDRKRAKEAAYSYNTVRESVNPMTDIRKQRQPKRPIPLNP